MDGTIREVSWREVRTSLGEIPAPPKRLWVAGSLPPPEHKLLALVGSRAATSYGKEACRTLIGGLRGYPISIVSGLALGIDGEAHRAALDAGLHTVAVPGSGLGANVLYPRSHHSLAHDILAKGGALISEHPPEHRARPEDFPSRNRIMVGLSDAVLVIEAGPASGTLITARLASEYNRELLMVPHRMGDAHGFGAHLFIRLGATLVAEPAHILTALHLESTETRSSDVLVTLAGNERLLYELLVEPLSRDELIRVSKLTANDALATLVTLELKGVLKEEFGAWRRAR